MEPSGPLRVDRCGARASTTVEREECSALCHYCGCRDMPLIRDYVAEHERATDLGGEAVRALDRGELGVANRLLRVMLTAPLALARSTACSP